MQSRNLVQILSTRLCSPLVVLGVGVTQFEETTTVQQTKQILDRVRCTQQQVGQHRAVGHTIDFAHHLDVEVAGTVLHGLCFVSQGHECIQGVEVLTTGVDCRQHRCLILLGHAAVVQTLAQCLNGRLHLRRLDDRIVGSQRGGVVLLVRLDAQAFQDTQTEVVHLSIVIAIDLGVPALSIQHVPMDLAGLWVDHVRGDTHTLLLPHGVLEVECSGVVSHRTNKLHKAAVLSLQIVVRGFLTGPIGLVHCLG